MYDSIKLGRCRECCLLQKSRTNNVEVILKKAKTCNEQQNHAVHCNICCLLPPHPFHLASKLGHTICRTNSISCCDAGKLPLLRLRVEIGRVECRSVGRNLPNESIRNWKEPNGKSLEWKMCGLAPSAWVTLSTPWVFVWLLDAHQGVMV